MRTARQLLVAGWALGLFLAGSVGAAAGPRISPVEGREYRISGNGGTAADTDAAVAWNQTDNTYLVVWQDGRNTGSRGLDIYGRLVGPDGVPAGPDFRISGPGATSDEKTPAVSWDGASAEYLVVWDDNRDFWLRGGDIYGRRVTAAGVPTGPDFRISGAGATSADEAPALAWNQTAAEFLVVWQDDRNAGDSSWDIYGRRVDSGGAPTGEDFRISGAKATGSEFDPAVAWNSTANQYLVVWNDYRSVAAGRGSDIYGRRLGGSGSPLGADFRVCGGSATGWEYEPAVAWNDIAKQYLVVWNDYRNVGTGRGSDIYGKRVSVEGSPVGSDFRISGVNARADDEDPAVVWNEAGNLYQVVWTDERNVAAGRGSDIYGRRLESDMTPVGGDFRISGPNATSYEQSPALAWNAGVGRHLVVWSDFRVPERGADIYGRRVNG